jgi:HEAT repeat protein
MQMNSEQALPILRKVLANRDADACSVEMRKKAVFVLAHHLDDKNVDIMLDVVRNDPDPDVKEGAVFWLSQVRGERALEALEDILLRSDERRLQEKAIFALSQQESVRASQILRDYAMRDDIPADLRANAIFWLGQAGHAENSKFLRDVYGRTSEPEIKEKIIFSLAQAGGAENARMLLSIATNEKEPIEIRKKAMYWAGQAGVAIEEMAALYDRLPDRDMREQVIFSLSQSDDGAAIDKLIEGR